MANCPTDTAAWQPVVALALRDGEGRYLLQQRPLPKPHGGLWEFPGGKVETGENPRLALVREIAEELGIAIEASALTPLALADDGPSSRVVLLLYTANVWQGKICASDGQAWGWFTPDQAALLPLAPMDRQLLARLAD